MFNTSFNLRVFSMGGGYHPHTRDFDGLHNHLGGGIIIIFLFLFYFALLCFVLLYFVLSFYFYFKMIPKDGVTIT